MLPETSWQYSILFTGLVLNSSSLKKNGYYLSLKNEESLRKIILKQILLGLAKKIVFFCC